MQLQLQCSGPTQGLNSILCDIVQAIASIRKLFLVFLVMFIIRVGHTIWTGLIALVSKMGNMRRNF